MVYLFLSTAHEEKLFPRMNQYLWILLAL